MEFDSPTYLWGMVAAVIPLLLHLINRRQAQVHDFAAIEFLLASNRHVARRLKLKQWLLMFVRMVLIAALPMAFAKPFTTSPSATLVGTTEPASVVFVIDPSVSMGYQIGDGGTLLERALQRAQDIVRDLRNESDVAVILATSPPTALTQRLSFDRQEIINLLSTVELSQGRADLMGALRLAEQILVESGHARREVILLSDGQSTEWEGASRPWSLDHAPSVTVVDISGGLERRNRGIVGVAAEPDGGGIGRNVRITVDVLNDQPVAFEDNVTVKIGQKTVKGFLRIPPFSEGQKVFTIRLPDMGLKTGVVELAPDELPGDDSRHFVIDFLRRVHVLVVNGSSRTVPYKDEAFFLRAALQPGTDSGSRITPTYVKPDELTPRQLEVVDVVILANVSGLDRPQVDALTGWVKRGGGLFITAGENVTDGVYNDKLRALLPLPIRDSGVVSDPPVFFTGGSTSHPAMSPFSRLETASLFSAGTRRYVLLETDSTANVEVLLSFTGGAPALVERSVDDGKVVMFTTSIDRDWTELPFKTSFLPLVQQLVLHLARRLDPPESRSITVGETRRIHLERQVGTLEVVRPNGQVVELQGDALAGDEAIFQDTGLAGVYSVTQNNDGSKTEKRFAVHIDPLESNLRDVEISDIQAIINPPGTPIVPTEQTESSPQQRDDIWPMVLITLFGVLGVETWLAWQSA